MATRRALAAVASALLAAAAAGRVAAIYLQQEFPQNAQGIVIG